MNRNAWKSWIVSKSAWACLAAAALLGSGVAQPRRSPQGKDAGGKAAANKYIGAEKCKNCHQAKEAGDPYGSWHKTGHAKAFETLASDAAKAIAKAKGIPDAQKSDECLACHSTAFGVEPDRIKKGFDAKAGVQCETCHGPGEQHMKARLAAAAKAAGGSEGFGEGEAAPRQELPAGEIVSTVDSKTCVACHNERSPTFKPFCFFERSAAIAHLDPRKPRKPEQILVCGCSPCACKNGCEPGTCGVPAKK